MRRLRDQDIRRRALTDLHATLLVESAAGTGKTALLAGRVVFLLAASVPPSAIAAITFTEFAAGELRERVTQFLDQLLANTIPIELKLAFPRGLSRRKRAALVKARQRLDELTCSTIHGFCHALLRAYAVEAGIDPGAEILDEVHADLAFGSIFERWLRNRLDGPTRRDDPIAVIAESDPIIAESLLRDFSEFRRAHRTGQAAPSTLEPSADVELVESVAEFRRCFASAGGPSDAEEDVIAFETLARHFQGHFNPLPAFDGLWRLSHPPRVTTMTPRTLNLRRFRSHAAWRRAGGPDRGERLAEQAEAHYDRCAREFRRLMGHIATAIAATFSAELNALLENFDTFKRNAAVLDFDDLLYITRRVLRDHENVRSAAAARFTRILVDEFQDTDPIQAEIIFQLAGLPGEGGANWQDRRLLPGHLFMVGDPKQAIYRFRGADIATYRLARTALERQFPGNVLRVTSNFRSRPPIVDHINECFQAPFEVQASEYVRLESTREPVDHGLPCVAKIKIDVMPQSRVDDIRDEEARIVAEVCARLIGNATITDAEGRRRPLAPGDIALLAPTGTELWRYERTLEEAGLPFSSQAGKNLFRRQEVQDLVAVVRALADSRDTLALGAVLRGPLVGLTEQELLDITAALPNDGAELPRLTLRADPAHITHPVARETLTILRELRRRVRSTAPSLLIAEAVERLNTRPILMARGADQASRSLANVDAILERARPYGVRGFREFARDLHVDWSRRVAQAEGVVDSDGETIDLVTIHSSKGLEWPVVIPINTASGMRGPPQFIHRRSDDTLHWCMGNIVPPSLSDVLEEEATEAAAERLRLLYVASTRAMELLAIPALSWTDERSWARSLDLKLDRVAELDLSTLTTIPYQRATERANEQTAARFAQERSRVDASFPKIDWIRPSDGDPDLVQFELSPSVETDGVLEATPVAGRGSMRGGILHKMMEEVLTGEVDDNVAALERRASVLMEQLAQVANSAPDAEEMARTVLRTLALEPIAKHRQELIPEVPIFGALDGSGERLVSGRADAVLYLDGKADIVFDWKSDAIPQNQQREIYGAQIAQYVRVLAARRGAIVYMTTGELQWIDSSPP